MNNKKKLVIVHGWADDPTEGWLGNVAETFRGRGVQVIAPQLPNPKEPEKEVWMKTFTEAVGEVDEYTYFLAHSLGGQVVLRFLEELPEGVQVGGVVFVASRCTVDYSIVEDRDAPLWRHTWVGPDRDFARIRSHLRDGTVITILSEDDYFIPVKVADEFRDLLGAEVTILPNRGHFMRVRDNCTELPEAVAATERLISAA